MDLYTQDSKELEAKRAIEKHQAALAKVWTDFPEFPRLMMRCGNVVKAYAEDKGVDQSQVKIGDIRWHNSGLVTAELYATPLEIINVKDRVGVLQKVLWGLGGQLVAMCEMRDNMRPRRIQFSGVRVNGTHLTFKIRHANKPLGPMEVQLT